MSEPDPQVSFSGADPGHPLVSVVVPAYNAGPFIRESLESIARQSYPRFEVIVMDDGSTDDTPSVVRSTVQRDTRFEYVRQPENRGQFENVNDGIARARGDLIAVFHADDVYHPEILEREVTYLEEHPEAGAVFCLVRFMDSEGREYGCLELLPEASSEEPLTFPTVVNTLLSNKNHFLAGPTALVRREVYETVGGYRPEFDIAADLDMWVRIARHRPIGIIPEHLMWYRHFHGNATQRYFHLRSRPDPFFLVMDSCLAEGGKEAATARSLADYAAHRAEDALMRGINHYIRGDLEAARELLAQIESRTLVASRRVQRWRLLALLAGLRVAARLPRSDQLATAMRRRWHEKGAPP